MAGKEVFGVSRDGTKLSATVLHGKLGIGITNVVSRTGVAVEVSREDATRLMCALRQFLKPDPTACARCGDNAVAMARRLYREEMEPACAACLKGMVGASAVQLSAVSGA